MYRFLDIVDLVVILLFVYYYTVIHWGWYYISVTRNFIYLSQPSVHRGSELHSNQIFNVAMVYANNPQRYSRNSKPIFYNISHFYSKQAELDFGGSFGRFKHSSNWNNHLVLC